ncbi:MAG: hypothetical protein ACP5IX_02855 [Patescibacteria group bacterium]
MFDKSKVEKTLLKLYNETKAETGLDLENISQLNQFTLPSNESALPISPSSDIISKKSSPDQSQSENIAQSLLLKNLEQLTPSEIREILISGGMDAKLLEQIDDQTLKKIFLDVLKQQQFAP